jgi:archaellum biogenesis protein FlaJ (TadC family)
MFADVYERLKGHEQALLELLYDATAPKNLLVYTSQDVKTQEKKTMKMILYCATGICAFSALAVAGPSAAATTPEPATMLLMGVSLAGIGVFAWRRNRKG